MKKLTLLGLTVAAMLNTCAIAADIQNEENGKEVVVTATKTAISTSDAPASVTIITADDLKKKGIKNVVDALKSIEGVYAKGGGDFGPGSNNTVTLRGFPMSSRTLVMLDGQPMNDGFSAAVDYSSVTTENIERIEVVRGPFSSLYGGNAMGGVVNIVTKNPNKPQTLIKESYGANNARKLGVSYQNRGLDDKLGYIISYGSQATDGYVTDYVVKTTGAPVAGAPAVTGNIPTTTNTGTAAMIVGNKGTKSWTQDNIALKMFYDINSTSKMTVGVSYDNYDVKPKNPASYLVNASGAPVMTGNVTVTENGVARNIALTQANFIGTPFGGGSTKYSIGYDAKLNPDTQLKVDVGYMLNANWNISAGAAATTAGGAGKYSDNPSNKLNSTVQVSFPMFGNSFLTMGIADISDQLNKKEYAISNWQDKMSQTGLTYLVDGRNTNYGAFIQDEIGINDHLTAYLGGRYDYWETDGTVNLTGVGVPTNYPTRNASAFSPKAALVYKPWENTTFRTSYGSAFRAPTVYDLYSIFVSGANTYNNNPNLKPETTTSWEVGAEQVFATGTMIRATYFDNSLTDLIYNSATTPTTIDKKNAGQATIKGAELGIRQTITPGITGFVNGTYTDGKITANTAVPLSVGKQITYSPLYQYNVGFDYKGGAWYGSLTGSYIDKVYANDQNLDKVNGVFTSYDPYFIVNLNVGYKVGDNLSVSVAVNNLLNAQYFQYYKATGSTLMASAELKF